MTIGYSRSREEISQRAAELSKAVRDSLLEWVKFKDALDNIGQAELLETLEDAADVATLTNASIDMELLYGIFTGHAAQPEPRDFTFNIKRMWGLR